MTSLPCICIVSSSYSANKFCNNSESLHTSPVIIKTRPNKCQNAACKTSALRFKKQTKQNVGQIRLIETSLPDFNLFSDRQGKKGDGIAFIFSNLFICNEYTFGDNLWIFSHCYQISITCSCSKHLEIPQSIFITSWILFIYLFLVIADCSCLNMIKSPRKITLTCM